MARLTLTEAQFQRQVIDLARACGWMVAHFRPALTRRGRWSTPVQADGAGFPDLICVKPRRIVAAELKAGRGRVTEAQRRWLGRLALAGAECYIWRPESWDAIVKVLKNWE